MSIRFNYLNFSTVTPLDRLLNSHAALATAAAEASTNYSILHACRLLIFSHHHTVLMHNTLMGRFRKTPLAARRPRSHRENLPKSQRVHKQKGKKKIIQILVQVPQREWLNLSPLMCAEPVCVFFLRTQRIMIIRCARRTFLGHKNTTDDALTTRDVSETRVHTPPCSSHRTGMRAFLLVKCVHTEPYGSTSCVEISLTPGARKISNRHRRLRALQHGFERLCVRAPGEFGVKTCFQLVRVIVAADRCCDHKICKPINKIPK